MNWGLALAITRINGCHIGWKKLQLFSYGILSVEIDNAGPDIFLGAFRPTQIEGMRPVSVTGDLANAMPAAWFELGARAR